MHKFMNQVQAKIEHLSHVRAQHVLVQLELQFWQGRSPARNDWTLEERWQALALGFCPQQVLVSLDRLISR